MALKVIILTILMLCGCATTATNPALRKEKGGITVHVENYHWDNAVVYVMRGSSKRRIGSADTGIRREMYIPSAYVMGGYLQLYVRFIGSRETLTTPLVPVWVGQHVNFVIRNYLPFSYIIPRRFQPEGASYHRMQSLQPLQQAFSSRLQRGITNV